MTAHDWYVEHREAYATRTLEPQEEICFEDHLPLCDECRSAVETVEAELGWLAMGVTPRNPRPGFARAIALNVLDHEVRPLWRRYVEPFALAAVLALAVGLGLVARRAAVLQSELDATQYALSGLVDTLGIIQNASLVRRASIRYVGADASMTVFADATKDRWKIVIHGLPPAPVGLSYHFWFICPEGTVKAADVQMATSTSSILTLFTPANLGGVRGILLTTESDAMTTMPTGRQLVNLRL